MLVTAGARGIGLAIAKAFHDNGARLYICDIDTDALKQFYNARPDTHVRTTNISDSSQVDALFDSVKQALSGLDVLVNNAGIAGPTKPVDEITDAEWRDTLGVNIDSQFYCTRRAVPLLKAAGGGSIVNIASTAGIMGYPMRLPYAVAKWGVVGLTKTLAMELGEHNIRVNAICPGAVKGPRMDSVIVAEAAAGGASEDAIREGYLRQTSLRTFIDADDIAHAALFLSSVVGSKITGQALGVDANTETLRTL